MWMADMMSSSSCAHQAIARLLKKTSGGNRIGTCPDQERALFHRGHLGCFSARRNHISPEGRSRPEGKAPWDVRPGCRTRLVSGESLRMSNEGKCNQPN